MSSGGIEREHWPEIGCYSYMTLGKFKGVKLIHLNGTVDAKKFIIIKKKNEQKVYYVILIPSLSIM